MTVDDVIGKVLDDEGGIKDVGDGKGVTRFGMTPQFLSDHGLTPPTTRAEAHTNYAIWLGRIGVTAVIQRDGYVGWLLADMCVHHGATQAVKILQRTLGVPDDGKLGPQTINAVPVNSPHFAKRLVAARVRFYGELLASEAVDRRRWAKGWLNRVSRQIEAIP